MTGGWMSALGGMGGVGSLGGAAGGAASAGGGFMSTLGSIGKGLGRAADYYNNAGKGGGQRSVSGWADASQQPQNALQDEVKRQLEAMKQERVLQDLMRYQPLEGQGGVSGLTINPYR